ncbi:hypothetical protein JCM19238_4097 [Vibrio ponticus]|nr:hypothetical protein JCM19238_4097 [Vibrio ponticus]
MVLSKKIYGEIDKLVNNLCWCSPDNAFFCQDLGNSEEVTSFICNRYSLKSELVNFSQDFFSFKGLLLFDHPKLGVLLFESGFFSVGGKFKALSLGENRYIKVNKLDLFGEAIVVFFDEFRVDKKSKERIQIKINEYICHGTKSIKNLSLFFKLCQITQLSLVFFINIVAIRYFLNSPDDDVISLFLIPICSLLILYMILGYAYERLASFLEVNYRFREECCRISILTGFLASESEANINNLIAHCKRLRENKLKVLFSLMFLPTLVFSMIRLPVILVLLLLFVTLFYCWCSFSRRNLSCDASERYVQKLIFYMVNNLDTIKQLDCVRVYFNEWINIEKNIYETEMKNSSKENFSTFLDFAFLSFISIIIFLSMLVIGQFTNYNDIDEDINIYMVLVFYFSLTFSLSAKNVLYGFISSLNDYFKFNSFSLSLEHDSRKNKSIVFENSVSIVISNLKLRYGCYLSQSLHGEVDVLIKSDKVVTIEGDSSTGKSVLLKTIAGVEKPETGRVDVCGLAINSFSDEMRSSVFCFCDGNVETFFLSEKLDLLGFLTITCPGKVKLNRVNKILDIVA